MRKTGHEKERGMDTNSNEMEKKCGKRGAEESANSGEKKPPKNTSRLI